MLGLALAQLAAQDLDREILVRTDIGGQTHAFNQDCRDAGIRFSVGYELSQTVRQAILDLSETAWAQAINVDGEDRDGAWVAELTNAIDLSAWPEGHTCFLTDQDGGIAVGHPGTTAEWVRLPRQCRWWSFRGRRSLVML